MKQESFKMPEYNEALLTQIAEIKSSLTKGPKTRSTNPKWNYLCNGKMKGGCIVFGGWLKVIPDVGDRYAYCAYGGLGVGGWNHDCSIYSIYTDIGDLYSNAISCMLVSGSSLADDPMIGAATDCIFYNNHSTIVGIASTDAGVAALVGGTVKWEKK